MTCVSLSAVENRVGYSTAFDYPDDGGADEPRPREDAPAHDLAGALRAIVCDRLIHRSKHDGHLCISTTVARLLVLGEILQPSGRSLRSLASELNVSAAILSRIGLKFADELGLRTRWQRHELRDAYSVRQRAVAAGTYRCTDKHERRCIARKRLAEAAKGASR